MADNKSMPARYDRMPGQLKFTELSREGSNLRPRRETKPVPTGGVAVSSDVYYKEGVEAEEPTVKSRLGRPVIVDPPENEPETTQDLTEPVQVLQDETEEKDQIETTTENTAESLVEAEFGEADVVTDSQVTAMLEPGESVEETDDKPPATEDDSDA